MSPLSKVEVMVMRSCTPLLLLLQATPGEPGHQHSTPGAHSGNSFQGADADIWFKKQKYAGYVRHPNQNKKDHLRSGKGALAHKSRMMNLSKNFPWDKINLQRMEMRNGINLHRREMGRKERSKKSGLRKARGLEDPYCEARDTFSDEHYFMIFLILCLGRHCKNGRN